MSPRDGEIYALLVDVGGEGQAEKEGPDATVVTVARVGQALENQAAVYQVVARYRWVGLVQTVIYSKIKALVEHWRAWRVVVDATGLGAGLASFLERAFPTKVRPFIFTQQSKSQLGWDFVAAVETGRYKEYGVVDPSPGSFAALRTGSSPDPSPQLAVVDPTPGPSPQLAVVERGTDELQRLFWGEVRACEGTVAAGPSKSLRWGVAEGRRDGLTGERLHDDLLISAALCVTLDNEPVGRAVSELIPPRDIFEGMGKVY